MKYLKTYENHNTTEEFLDDYYELEEEIEEPQSYLTSFSQEYFKYVPYIIRFLKKNNIKTTLRFNDVYSYFDIVIKVTNEELEKLPKQKSPDKFSFKDGYYYYFPFNDNNKFGKKMGSMDDDDDDEQPSYNDPNWEDIEINTEEDIEKLEDLIIAHKYNV